MQNKINITMVTFGGMCTQLGLMRLNNVDDTCWTVDFLKDYESVLLGYTDSDLYKYQNILGIRFESKELLEDLEFARVFGGCLIDNGRYTVVDYLGTLDKRESHTYGRTTIAMRAWLAAVSGFDGNFESLLMSAKYADNKLDKRRDWLTDLRLSITPYQATNTLVLKLVHVSKGGYGDNLSDPVKRVLNLDAFIQAKDPTAFIKTYLPDMAREIKPY